MRGIAIGTSHIAFIRQRPFVAINGWKPGIALRLGINQRQI
jgi:hypothetical protein